MDVNNAELILLVGAAIGLTFSLLTMWLIFQQGKFNGFICIILHMTTCQILYEISMLMTLTPYDEVNTCWHGLRVFSGSATTLFTNVLAFTIQFVILYKKGFNILYHLNTIRLIVFIPSAIVCILSIYGFIIKDEDYILISSWLYVGIRSISMIFNFIVCTLLCIDRYLNTGYLFKINPNDPVSLLAAKIIGYPIVQVFSFLGLLIFNICLYIGNVDLYFPDLSSYSLQVQSGAYASAILLPSAGFGYFAVYVLINKPARKYLLSLFQKNKLTSLFPLSDNSFIESQHSRHTGTFRWQTGTGTGSKNALSSDEKYNSSFAEIGIGTGIVLSERLSSSSSTPSNHESDSDNTNTACSRTGSSEAGAGAGGPASSPLPLTLMDEDDLTKMIEQTYAAQLIANSQSFRSSIHLKNSAISLGENIL